MATLFCHTKMKKIAEVIYKDANDITIICSDKFPSETYWVYFCEFDTGDGIKSLIKDYGKKTKR